MRMCTLVKNSKILMLLAFLAVVFCGQSSVYANILESNQCAKLLEVPKQAPSFKEFMKQKVRAAQEAQSKSAVEQKAEEAKRKEEEKRQREDMDPLTRADKIQFIKVNPAEFLRDVNDVKVITKIENAYEIMNSKMTRVMYAKLMLLIGVKNPIHIFPSIEIFGTEDYEFPHFNVPISMNAAVNNVKYRDVVRMLVKGLNVLSYSDDPKIQESLKKLIPSFEKYDQFDLPAEIQFEYILKNAKTKNGDNLDALRHDYHELSKYADSPSRLNIAQQERKFLPLYIDGSPVYIGGKEMELIKEAVNLSSLFKAPNVGTNASGDNGLRAIARAGPWRAIFGCLWSSQRRFVSPYKSDKELSFRLVRTSRGYSDVNYNNLENEKSDLAIHIFNLTGSIGPLGGTP